MLFYFTAPLDNMIGEAAQIAQASESANHASTHDNRDAPNRPIQTAEGILKKELENCKLDSGYWLSMFRMEIESYKRRQMTFDVKDPDLISRFREHAYDIGEDDALHTFLDQIHLLNTFVLNTLKNDLLEKLDLNKYYPGKIGIQDVMHIHYEVEEPPPKWTDLPWVMLEKLVMMDYRARDVDIDKCIEHSEEQNVCDDDTSDDAQHPHPLDVLLVVFQCCDPFLQQLLAKKMFQCRLALPFLIPHDDAGLTCGLWPLKRIVAEWRNVNNEACEESFTQHPTSIVSFMRLGRPSFSKSKLLNDVISNRPHDTFCHYDSPNGSNPRHITDGLVEISHYLPSGEKSDIFSKELIFLNLRGNCCKFDSQNEVMTKLSVAFLIIVDIEEINSFKGKIKHLIDNKTVVLLTTERKIPQENSKIKSCCESCQTILLEAGGDKNLMIQAFTKHKCKNASDIVKQVREKIISILKPNESCLSLDAHCNSIADRVHLYEREVQPSTFDFTLIQEINDKKTSIAECKKAMLPLQGKHWHEWSNLQKKKNRAKQSRDEQPLIDFKDSVSVQMDECRKQQMTFATELTPLMHNFTKSLEETISNKDDTMYLIQCLKIKLDELSINTLPHLQREYKKYWDECSSAKAEFDNERVNNLESQMNALEQKIADSAFGFEHLLREIGQLYEVSVWKTPTPTYPSLPKIAAQLLLYGVPFELMDGDAGCVPLTWVKAVLSELQYLIGDKQVLVLSVIGIQSSGKSTLLNTMFGLEFAVSAGRCTRGVYAQLLPVIHKEKEEKLPFDYLMVLDSEGLRAPELGNKKYNHDNELATFVIGLADLTLVNLKGENTMEMQDILQITVHAFLRMSLAGSSKRQRCMFVHQNVAAINANEKMMQGHKKFQETLDQMTKDAAHAENVRGKEYLFTDVIRFSGQDDVMYLSDLWSGDPPMAPINPGYSEKARGVRKSILQRFVTAKPEILKISDLQAKISDLWNAILSDDFVFSFRNSLYIRAHLILERKFSKLKYELEQDIWGEIKNHESQIRKCEKEEDLERETADAIKNMKERINIVYEEKKDKLKLFFNNNEYSAILNDFQREKIVSIKSYAENEKIKVEHRLLMQRDQKYKALKNMSKIEAHRDQLMENAVVIAKEFRKNKQTPDGKTIDERFEIIWASLQEKELNETSMENIRKSMEAVLHRELYKEGISIQYNFQFVRNKANISRDFVKKFTANEISDDDFTLDTKDRSAAKEIIKTNVNKCLKLITNHLNDICKGADTYFSSQCENFVHSSLQEFDCTVQNQPAAITATFKAKFASHVVNYAILRYSKEFRKSRERIGTKDTFDIQDQMEKALLDEFDALGQQKHIRSYLVYFNDDEPFTICLYQTQQAIDESIHIQFRPGNEELDFKANRKKILGALNDILGKLDRKLEDICSEDSLFNSIHGTDFVRSILGVFTEFNQQVTNPFTFTVDYQAYIAIIAARHASLKFEAMNIQYEMTHEGGSELEQRKAEYKTLFAHQVEAVESSVTAAEMFSDIIKREVEENAIKEVSRQIGEYVMKSVGFSKQDLMVKIMRDLADRKDIQSYIDYISDAFGFASSWLKQYIEKLVFKTLANDDSSLYTQLANAYVKTLFDSILESNKSASNKAANKLDHWITQFCEGMKKHIVTIRETDFKAIKDLDVTDISRMSQLIEESLPSLQDGILNNIKHSTKRNVTWEHERPDVLVLKRLWGCKQLCPICSEPCKKTESDHTDSHECIQHRPKAVSGLCDKITITPLMEICSDSVSSSDVFFCVSPSCSCRKGDKKNGDRVEMREHFIRDYKEHHPRWDIPPIAVGESSKYWKYFMCQFQHQLSKHYCYKAPKIPQSWHSIHKEAAIDSLGCTDA